jgi:1-deoxy-D-xylulose-5-phosphate reductoisomerase
MPAALNAANEEAVGAFLDGRIGFPVIAETIDRVLNETNPGPASTVDDVLGADATARRAARRILKVTSDKASRSCGPGLHEVRA